MAFETLVNTSTDLSGDSSNQSAKKRNMMLLSDILDSQTVNDADYVADKVIDNALHIIFHLNHQPEIFKTGRNSLHLQFELADRSYMELEVFSDRITCMIVPDRAYSQASYPDISLNDMEKINKIVGDFYGDK